jgi:hypothetical protein
MRAKPKLKLEATGQFLSMPLVGAHDNHEAVKPAVERCIAQLARISGH